MVEVLDREAFIQVAAIVAGAGASGAITGVVKSVVPQIAPDIAGAAAGGLIWYFGRRYHPLLGAFGVGVLAGSLKGVIEKAIPTLAPAVAPAPTIAAKTPAAQAAAIYVMSR